MFSLVYECAMTGLSKSDRGEPGGLPGGGDFIWAFRALVVFSTCRELRKMEVGDGSSRLSKGLGL